jgi:membrane-associated protease RseP (regulator of RpoE activity)
MDGIICHPAWNAFYCIVLVGLLSACAAPQVLSYTGRSYVPVLELTDKERDQVNGDTEVRETTTLNTDAERLYHDGYELVGFSQFISPLAPLLAKTNFRATGRAQGATLVLAEPPENARFQQHFFRATDWRKAQPDDYILGAWYADLPSSVLAAVDCQNNVVMVQEVLAGTPAAQQGLRRGDTLWSANGERITSAAVLDRLLLAHAGGPLELIIARDDGVVTLPLQLNRNRRNIVMPAANSASPAGFQVDRMELEAGEGKDGEAGFYIAGIEAGSPACIADLQASDRIIDIDKKPMASIKQLEPLASLSKATELTIRRGTRNYEITLKPADNSHSQRAALPEASYGTPWHNSKPSDWSALAGTLQAAQILLSAANQYTSAQIAMAQKENARRATLYRRIQAERAAEPLVWEGRGRVLYTRASNGQIVSIDRATASAMAANPGSTVDVVRGRASLIDVYGKRIITQQQAPVVKLARVNPVLKQADWLQGQVDAAVATVDLGMYTTRALERNARIRSGEPVYGEIWQPVRHGDPLYDWRGF